MALVHEAFCRHRIYFWHLKWRKVSWRVACSLFSVLIYLFFHVHVVPLRLDLHITIHWLVCTGKRKKKVAKQIIVSHPVLIDASHYRVRPLKCHTVWLHLKIILKGGKLLEKNKIKNKTHITLFKGSLHRWGNK